MIYENNRCEQATGASLSSKQTLGLVPSDSDSGFKSQSQSRCHTKLYWGSLHESVPSQMLSLLEHIEIHWVESGVILETFAKVYSRY